MFSQLLSVCVVLALVAFAAWWLRRGNITLPRRSQRVKTIEMIDRISISPHVSVHVLRIGDTRVAIAAHNSGVTVLHRMPTNTPARADGGAP
jgi:flagellar biogenesis protein FliO